MSKKTKGVSFRAILTTYSPPGVKRGARYFAKDSAGNRAEVKVSPEWENNTHQGHEAAARAFCTKLGWHGVLVRGSIWNAGEVWVWRQHQSGELADEIRV